MRSSFNRKALLRDYIENPYRFVCTLEQFLYRYGRPANDRDKAFASRYCVLCRDGMVRPRSRSELK